GTGQIRGVVFRDYNANGVQDVNDPGLPDRTIYLDTNDDGRLDAGESSATTTSNGSYAFLNLAAGPYTLRQVFVPDHGVVRTSPSGFTYRETVTGGSDLAGRDFGNVFISQVSPVEVAATIFPPSPDAATAF